MTDYQNSHKSKESKPEEPEIVPKHLTKIVTTKVVVKPKGIGKKFKAIFFGGDFKNAARFVVADVMLPAARDMVMDVGSKGLERIIYGDRFARRRGSSFEYRGNVQYNTPVRRAYRSSILPDQPPRLTPINRVQVHRRESNDVFIADREQAREVLQTMIECVEKYEAVSVADLNELIGQPSANVDQTWGWTNLSEASVRQVRDGYLIELPPMEEL